MSSVATINLSNSSKSPQIIHVGGSQTSPKGQVFHVGGNNPESNFSNSPIQMNMQGPKLAYSASNFPSEAQQQQYQQQFQMQPQYQPQQQFQMQPQYQPQQQFQMQQQYQPQQQSSDPQYFQQQQNVYQRQPEYFQAQYQPQEQFQQQYQTLSQQQFNPVQFNQSHPQMTIQTRDMMKPPVFEAPIEKIQIVKKNQSAPPKFPEINMQQSFRSSRSGSLAALEEITDPPHFIKHPEHQQITNEGEPISLSARVTPAGDPNLTVQWYKDGKPLAAGSRINTSFERGFAILDILYTFKEDSGEYSCVGKNNFGMDQTTPSIIIVNIDESVVLNSQLPQEMSESIAAIEASLNHTKPVDVYSDAPVRPPQFIKPMPGLYNLQGGQSLHLETRVMPINDSSLEIEWFKNGRPLNNGCRFNVIFDRGFAILDIIGVISEDTGDYFCYARNKAGQAQSNIIRLIVAAEETVVTKSQLPKESVQYLQSLDANLLDDVDKSNFRYEEEEEKESLPHFDIKPVNLNVEEGNPARFLVKVSGYPRPQIQWFMNDCLVAPTSTQKVYSDGSISYLEFQKCKMPGESYIVVSAKNKLGEAVSNATLNVIPENDFRPELKRTDPENPFRKLATLKKVSVSPELQNAFRKTKPSAIQLNNVERNLVKSKEASEAENLYANVQSRLRRSDKLSYAGAPTGGQTPMYNASYPEEQETGPTTQTSQVTMQIGSLNFNS